MGRVQTQAPCFILMLVATMSALPHHQISLLEKAASNVRAAATAAANDEAGSMRSVGTPDSRTPRRLRIESGDSGGSTGGGGAAGAGGSARGAARPSPRASVGSASVTSGSREPSNDDRIKRALAQRLESLLSENQTVREKVTVTRSILP